jgi:hypothetical protein
MTLTTRVEEDAMAVTAQWDAGLMGAARGLGRRCLDDVDPCKSLTLGLGLASFGFLSSEFGV